MSAHSSPTPGAGLKKTSRISLGLQPSHATNRRTFKPFGGARTNAAPDPLCRTGGQMGQIETARMVLH